jgi:dTDP-4-amino-4,6-dideoxygalactose transaminase
MEWRVPLADLDYGVEEERAVLDVLHSKWLTMGAVTQKFEAAFAKMLGVRYAFAVSNATEALHLAYRSLGIGPGDEVITPSLTFVATSNAALYTGADVCLADVTSADDLTLSPADVLAKITPRTRAIAPMHYAGYPCAMPALLEIAHQHGLAVVEDAAHSPGAWLDGIRLGSWGDVGCFSFFSNKNLSTGEGGMVVTQREDLAERIRLMRSHGMTSLTYDRHQGHAYSYDVVELGYNDRIDELHSALGLAQLTKLEANNRRRQAWTETYWQLLEGSGLGLPFRRYRGQPAFHLFPALLPEGVDRYRFIDQMRAQGIQTSIHYPPTHRFQYYRQRYGEIRLANTEAIAAHEITLPLYPGMGAERVHWVVDAVKNALASPMHP